MDSRAQETEPGKEFLAEEVNGSLGVPENEGEEHSQSMEGDTHDEHSGSSKKRPSGWERLKAKNRAYERELHELRATVGDLQSRMQPNESLQEPQYGGGNSNVDEQIQKAVSYALQHKELEERKAHQAMQAQHLNRLYEGLHGHLDRMSDKYEDFDDMVRGSNVPITEAMRDASLFLPQEGPGSAGEVLYKLAKNPDELDRIGRLHPIEQARELQKLSRSLEYGGGKGVQSAPKTLNNLRTNPASNNSQVITDKTPVHDLRRRMKANSTSWGGR